MNTLFNKLKKSVKKTLALIPTKLPTGIAEFESWADSIIELYDAPKNDSVRFSLAVMVLHLDSTTSSKPKAFFGKSLTKAASNQVVSQVIQDLKAKQQAEIEAAKAQTAEVTASPMVASDGSKE